MPPIDVVTKRMPRHFSPAKYAQKICQSRFWAEIVATAWQLIEEQGEIYTAGNRNRGRSMGLRDLWFCRSKDGCRHFDICRYYVDSFCGIAATYFPFGKNLCDLRAVRRALALV